MTKFEKRMRAQDPNYGAYEHQRAFVWRLERCQELAACPKDEVNTDHEHGPECYSEAVKVQVMREQNKRRASTGILT